MSHVSLMVVSIGLALFLRHVILLFFGGAPRKYSQYAVQRTWSLGPVDMVPKDVAITIICIAVLVAVGLMLKGTRLGTAMRAVADNRDLAESSGIDVQRVILATWVG